MTDPLDPKTPPQGSRGKRSATGAPILVSIASLALVGIAFVYDSMGSATESGAEEEEQRIESSRPVVDGLLSGYGAGQVPVQVTRADKSAGKRGALARDPGGPPLPGDERSGDAGIPRGALPIVRPSRGREAGSLGKRRPAAGLHSAQDSARAEIEQARMDLLREALRANTGTELPENKPGMPADRKSRLAQLRSQSDYASEVKSRYGERLRELQQAGLIPSKSEGVREQGQRGPYDQFAGGADRWRLDTKQEVPARYALLAGAFVPATLITGINSDLPGQVTALVSQDVRDTATGQYVLIPQGARLVGTYGSDVAGGQERVLVAWQRIVWPDGKSMDIGSMPGTDGAGYAGLKDKVNTHFWRMLTSSLLMSGVTAGITLSQGEFGADDGKQSVGSVMAQSLGNQVGQLTEELIRKQMNVAPTLEIRPGYRLNVSVTKDLRFNGPYVAFDYDRAIQAGAHTFRMKG